MHIVNEMNDESSCGLPSGRFAASKLAPAKSSATTYTAITGVYDASPGLRTGRPKWRRRSS